MMRFFLTCTYIARICSLNMNLTEDILSLDDNKVTR